MTKCNGQGILMSCHLMIGVLLCVGWAYMCTHSMYVYVCVSMVLYVFKLTCCVVCCVGGGCVLLCCVLCVVLVVVVCCCVVGSCVVVCCVLCTNITKLTCPLAVSGDCVPHELPSVSVSV